MRTGAVRIGSICNYCALPHPGLLTFFGFLFSGGQHDSQGIEIYILNLKHVGQKPKLKR